jgi:dolichol kinase
VTGATPTRAVGPLRAELARKAIHVASAVIPVAYALGLARAVLFAALAALGVTAVVVEVARRRSPRARAAFVAAFGPLLREHEHAGLSGATWLLAAYALSAVLFPRAVAVAAMLAAGLGDAAAAVVGRSVAVARARRGTAATALRGKTLAGSVACAVVTFAAALLVAALPLPAAVAAALAASVAERWEPPAALPRVDDNVRVALAAGGAALLATAAARALAGVL